MGETEDKKSNWNGVVSLCAIVIALASLFVSGWQGCSAKTQAEIAAVQAKIAADQAKIAADQAKDNALLVQAQTFTTMREGFTRYWDSVRKWEQENPGCDRLDDIAGCGCATRALDAARMYRQYWLVTRDEWYVTNKAGEGRLKALWDDYYEPAVKASLKNNPILRDVLCESLNPRSVLGKTYADQLEEFKRAIKGFPVGGSAGTVETHCARYELRFPIAGPPPPKAPHDCCKTLCRDTAQTSER